jgi:predicted deacylase
VDRLVMNYGKNRLSTQILDSVELAVVPLVNPDGLHLQERNVLHDIDLDRQFPTGHDLKNHARNSREYGWRPLEVPEAQATNSKVKELQPSLIVDFHSPGRLAGYSNVILTPFAYQRRLPELEILRMAQHMAEATGFTWAWSGQAHELSGGAGTDHYYKEYRIPSFVVETGNKFASGPVERDAMFERLIPLFEYIAMIADNPRELGSTKTVEDLDSHFEGAADAS